MTTILETVARAIASADGEDYMEDFQRYDARASAAMKAFMSPPKTTATLSIDPEDIRNEWRCCGCGILTPRKIRRCECATNAVVRGGVGGEQAWKLDQVSQVLLEQSEDEGLWFVAETPGEEILQQALRRLHEAIEGKTSEQCARAVLD
jgi:hypothetical protein